MRAFVLQRPAPIETQPLVAVDLPAREPVAGEIRLRVRACGICHTDLHTIEGEIVPPRYPVVPGHQIVGDVDAIGEGVRGWRKGERAGVPWLHSACGECEYCRRGRENLCPNATFTGFHVDGGYADYAWARADYALKLESDPPAESLAPLLCAGIIGYRSLRQADLQAGETLGLIGFGASAHLAIQLARHWGCTTFVFTRQEAHRSRALRLGAAWAGSIEDQAPALLDRAVLFAPNGELVAPVLRKLRPGGTLAINAIHMSNLPEMPYDLLYGERTVRSVANATRRDGEEFLKLAQRIPIRPTVVTYRWGDVHRALTDLKAGAVDGAAVLIP